jgi:hypothetical protein
MRTFLTRTLLAALLIGLHAPSLAAFSAACCPPRQEATPPGGHCHGGSAALAGDRHSSLTHGHSSDCPMTCCDAALGSVAVVVVTARIQLERSPLMPVTDRGASLPRVQPLLRLAERGPPATPSNS